MRDLIRREDAIDVLAYFDEKDPLGHTPQQIIMALPSVQPQRMRGKWVEKTVAENPKSAGIEEWQSCKCNNCGRYDTRPYLYYFIEPNYCSYCGAEMEGAEE